MTLRLVPQTSRGLPFVLKPLIHRPCMVSPFMARPSRAGFPILRKEIRQYSSESSHNEKDSVALKVFVALAAATGWGCEMYYCTLPVTSPEEPSAEPVPKETAQRSIPDEYDLASTPEHTREELQRQEYLNKYRRHLFYDLEDRCKHCCTESPVPCPLIQEMHTIYAREIGTDKKSLTNDQSGQNETRTTREELQRLARLGKERSSMIYRLKNRCEELCSDSPRPCPIWQELHKIHEREMDDQEEEGGDKGMLRRRLALDSVPLDNYYDENGQRHSDNARLAAALVRIACSCC